MKSVLVATPQANELQPLLGAFVLHGYPPRPVKLGSIECFEIPSLSMTIAIGGHGKTQFAVQTQYLVDRGRN